MVERVRTTCKKWVILTNIMHTLLYTSYHKLNETSTVPLHKIFQSRVKILGGRYKIPWPCFHFFLSAFSSDFFFFWHSGFTNICTLLSDSRTIIHVWCILLLQPLLILKTRFFDLCLLIHFFQSYCSTCIISFFPAETTLVVKLV